MKQFDDIALDKSSLLHTIQAGLPITITTYTLPWETEMYLESVIAVFLRFTALEKYKNNIFYCIRELTGNAKKANTKRAYFSEQGLDISIPDDYQEGMEDFKKITLNNITHYLKKQEKMGLYIKLVLQAQNNVMTIEIRNNAAATPAELARIHDRLRYAWQYSNPDEVVSQMLDNTEGAGLGLVILVLMLKKMGVTENGFEIHNEKNETVARIEIPFSSDVLLV